MTASRLAFVFEGAKIGAGIRWMSCLLQPQLRVLGTKETDMSKSNIVLRVFYSVAAVGIFVGIVVFASYFVRAMAMLSEPSTDSTQTADDFSSEPATAPVSSSQLPASLPPLPIAINVPARRLSGGGYVAYFHNTSDKAIRVVFDMEATTSHPGKREAMVIPASGTVELGWDRGWKLMTGDRVTLSCENYLPGTWKAP
jgi:hypothetical protein